MAKKIQKSKSIMLPTSSRFFGETAHTPDEVTFQIDNTSSQYYASRYYKLHQGILEPLPSRSRPVFNITLEEVIGKDRITEIQKSGKIIFHAVGDTGAAKKSGPKTEASVADMMVADFDVPVSTDRPSFFFHLGDVIYSFGEEQYYYDQLYEPFREYSAPIFAIPGNHDGLTHEGGPRSLDAFIKNFCTETPEHSKEAGGLVRTTMTQPGVYFTLDAPFVSIIGLYSNVLEGPGVISSQGGKYKNIDDQQIKFLVSELKRLKPLRNGNQISVIVAVHHPPYSADKKHGGGTGLLKNLDDAFKAAGLLPDAVISGHAHIYQRFTRDMGKGRQLPYIISGSGGYAMTPLKKMPDQTAIKTPFTIPGTDASLHQYIPAFGYLKIIATPNILSIMFNSPDPAYGKYADQITIDLQTNKIKVTKKQ
jgi:hypothetical protein